MPEGLYISDAAIIQVRFVQTGKIVKRRGTAGRPVSPRPRPSRHKFRPKEDTIYDSELGVNVKVGPREPPIVRFALKVRGAFRAAKDIWDVSSEPTPTRTVKIGKDELFAHPRATAENHAEL